MTVSTLRSNPTLSPFLLPPPSPFLLKPLPSLPRLPHPTRHLTLRFSPRETPPPAPNHPLSLLPPLLASSAATSAFLFLLLGLRVPPASSAPPPLLPPAVSSTQVEGSSEKAANLEEEELDSAFETWKSKTYALSVPLTVVALRGSVPPSWAKDFIQSQGKRLRLRTQFLGSLENIFSDLSMSFGNKKNVGPKSTAAADVVTIGDSSLSFAIKKAIIEPIQGAEDRDWYKSLSDKWKDVFVLRDMNCKEGENVIVVDCLLLAIFSGSFGETKIYLRRNCVGEIDSKGKIWAAPYRWGTMVIAYKKSKFKKHKLAPIEDWADLWRPELAGRISMVDSPREVVGAVLKYMGASYNARDIDLEVGGGRDEVLKNLALLTKQVRLFDSMHYLKAFGVGDVWVAVGWSSDVLPVAKRMSNVAVVVPKSGTSLWADLWAIPASRLQTSNVGGRVRGPSPLFHQWIEFCLQSARALPFIQEVIPGATPSALEGIHIEVAENLTRGKPRLDTNLIAGVPPSEILSRCEFLEPLSDQILSDYKWLIASIKNRRPDLIHRILNYVFSKFWPRPH